MRFRFAAVLPAAALVVTVTAGPIGTQASGDLVVTPKWLAAHLRDPDLVILHVGPKEGYDQAHIAGARFINLAAIDASPPRDTSKLSLEMPEPADLRRRLEQLGISDGSRIVVVEGAEWFTPSTRVVFTLQYAGFADRTSWLDGGIAGWVQAGNPTTGEVPGATAGRITRSAEPSLIVDHAFVERLSAGQPGIRLIDGRAPNFFEGPAQGRMKPGHIAGAANVPFNTLVGDGERLLSKPELAEKFRAAGVQPGDTVVAYCHIGQQATLVLFAARVLGHPVKLYDGSMDDWGKRDLPTVNAKP